DHQKVIYRCWKTVDKETIDLEILDTANKESVGSAAPSLESSIKWADGFQMMYSITDRSSFESASHLKRMSIDHVKQTLGIPTVIVVNKCDMENGDMFQLIHLSGAISNNFFELSAAECSVAVEVAVEKLVREVRLEYQRHLLAMDSHSSSPVARPCNGDEGISQKVYTHTHTHTQTHSVPMAYLVNAQLHRGSHSFDMALDNINGSLTESS
uniref:small monomeric GTPase n=1 Tax=Oncorhynchus kisutch TaxID=8019 RepID=A0A8C7H1L9_ONCKI